MPSRRECTGPKRYEYFIGRERYVLWNIFRRFAGLDAERFVQPSKPEIMNSSGFVLDS